MIKLKAKEMTGLISKFSFLKKYKIKPKSINTLKNPSINGIHFLFKDTPNYKLNKKYLVVSKKKRVGFDNTIVHQNPKHLLAEILEYLYQGRKKSNLKKYNNNIFISSTAQIDENVKIEPNTVINNDVIIKKNSSIGANTTIGHNVKIEDNVNIQANCSIGTDGFSYSLGNKNILLRHLGGLVINNGVDIGPQVNISSGQIEPTVINKNVKIDGQVYIGHNANIGEGSFLCAKSVIGGSVVLGKYVWVYPNSLITNKIIVEDKAKIGAGSIVVSNVKFNQTIVSYKAEEITEYQKKQIFLKKQINKK